MRGKCSLISCDLLLFSRNLFNFIARVWFNCFVHVSFYVFSRSYTLIFHIFVERDFIIFLTIFLTIFLSPTLFIFWGYAITINGNVINAVEMCITLFHIRWMSLWFLVKNINISLQVSVGCTQFICLIIEWLQHFFYLTDCHFLWYARAFKGWSAELFTAFIDMNITIPYIFFLFRSDWSLFFSLNIIRTQSF